VKAVCLETRTHGLTGAEFPQGNLATLQKVRGVIFDKTMSKFILTFSKQALVSGDFAQRVKYLATVINQSPNWKVTKTATRAIMVEKVDKSK